MLATCMHRDKHKRKDTIGQHVTGTPKQLKRGQNVNVCSWMLPTHSQRAQDEATCPLQAIKKVASMWQARQEDTLRKYV